MNNKHNSQCDAHCWKYYLVKFSYDYILQNRLRANANDKRVVFIER